jgi:hypothetical protein
VDAKQALAVGHTVPEPGGSTAWRVLATRRGGCGRCQGHYWTAAQRGRSGGPQGKAAEIPVFGFVFAPGIATRAFF